MVYWWKLTRRTEWAEWGFWWGEWDFWQGNGREGEEYGKEVSRNIGILTMHSVGFDKEVTGEDAYSDKEVGREGEDSHGQVSGEGMILIINSMGMGKVGFLTISEWADVDSANKQSRKDGDLDN